MEETVLQLLRRRTTALTGNFYKSLLLILSGLLFILLPILSMDAGLTDDERLHLEHGDRIAAFYFDGNKTAASDPFNAQGIWAIDEDPYDYPRLMNVYGGFFDLISSTIYRTVTHHFMGPYESKHMLSSWVGWGLLVLIAMFAYRMTDSWAAALLAFLVAAVSPRLIGHSLSNPKDIPFALAFGLGLYQILRALQEDLRLPWWRVTLLILTIIATIDTRVGGVILIFFLGLFAGALIVYRIAVEKQPIKGAIRPAGLLALVSVVSYFGASLFWPFALQDPLHNPIKCLNIFKSFTTLNSYELFEGHRINYWEIPSYFVPKWFYLTFPPVVMVGLVLFCVFAWLLMYRRPRVILQYGLLVFSVVFPLVTIIVNKSNIYDDCRHVYFMLVPLIALAGIGWYMVLRRISDWHVLNPLLALLLILLWQPFSFMLRSHPLEVLYFTPFIGGDQGAWRNYEIDYWGHSIRPAMDWIEHTDSALAKGRKTRVRMWYGEQLKLKYYTEKSKHLEYVLTEQRKADWDYTIMLPVEDKRNPGLMANWPPAGTVYQVMVDDAPVCAVVRNPLSDFGAGGEQSQQAPQADAGAQAAVPAGGHMAQGLAYYGAKDFNKAAKEFRKAVEENNKDSLAWNDLIASYNNLEMSQAAADAGVKAQQLFPRFELLNNNVKVAKDALPKIKLTEKYLLGLSYNFYVQEDYMGCINASNQLLRVNPRSDIAYNNICASQNNLGHYQEAKDAADKGLAIAPGNQLLKNNRALALKGLGQK